MKDFKVVEKEFERQCEAAARRLRKCIDARVAIIRKDVPGAAYCDAMGSSFLHDKTWKDGKDTLKGDPLYEAWNHFEDGTQPRRHPYEGEVLEPDHVRMIELFDKYSKLMKEIEEISTYMFDSVGYSYS